MIGKCDTKKKVTTEPSTVENRLCDSDMINCTFSLFVSGGKFIRDKFLMSIEES